MSTTVSMARGVATLPQVKARAAGAFWLMTIVMGAMALFAHGPLRAAANLGATASYVAATLLVYVVLKPVNRNVSLLAACLSFMGCVMGAVIGPLHLTQATRLPFLFFGMHCFLVGFLILRSGYLPRFVGVLMATAGVGWLIYSFVQLLPPRISAASSPYLMAAGILGEASLTLWLLVMGVNVERSGRQ
jgi:hypothetical protein